MMAKIHSAKLLLGLLVLLVIAAAVDAVQLARIHALNQAIADGSVASFAGDLPPRGMFARAYYLERKAEHQAALNLYKKLESEAEPALRQAQQ